MPTLSDHRNYIEALIAHNRIEAARNYCTRLPHPIARIWLSEINDRLPIEAYNPVTEPFRLYDGDVPADRFSEPATKTYAATVDEPPKSEPHISDENNYLAGLAFKVLIIVFGIFILRSNAFHTVGARYIIFLGILVLLFVVANSIDQPQSNSTQDKQPVPEADVPTVIRSGRIVSLSEHHQYVTDLIAHNRIQAARDYCQRLSHPNARLWLAEINQMFPIEQSPPDDTPSTPYGPLFDGEVSPQWRSALDWPVEFTDEPVEVTEKTKNYLQNAVNIRDWLGCIGYYVGAMLLFALLYTGALILVYKIVNLP